MSVSFKEQRDRLGLTNNLASSKYQKHRNIKGPVRLSDLPNYASGFQKMSVITDPKTGPRNRQGVNVEYMNNPVRLTPWGGLETTTGSGDPWGEQLSVLMGSSYQWTSANANVYIARKNPNAVERIKITAGVYTLPPHVVNAYTNQWSVVVATYPNWASASSGSETVIDALPRSVPAPYDKTITIPASGHEVMVISFQHTVGSGESASKNFGCGIYNFQAKYL